MLSPEYQRPSLQQWLKAYPKLEYNEYWHQYEAFCPVCGEKGCLVVPNTPNEPPVIQCSNCNPSTKNPDAYWAIRNAVGLPKKSIEIGHEYGEMDAAKFNKNSFTPLPRAYPRRFKPLTGKGLG